MVFVVLVPVLVIVTVVLLVVIVVVEVLVVAVRFEPPRRSCCRRGPSGHRGRCGCLCYRCGSCSHNVQTEKMFFS